MHAHENCIVAARACWNPNPAGVSHSQQKGRRARVCWARSQHGLAPKRRALYNAHVESQLKSEIIANPEKFVILDPEIAQTLLDQRAAGKKLVLITNSDFRYTDKLMSFAFDRFLPQVCAHPSRRKLTPAFFGNTACNR